MDIFDKQVLKAIRKHFALHSYSPSVQEIVDAIGVNSTGLVHESLGRLRDEGLVTWTPRRARTLRLVEMSTVSVVKERKGVPTVLQFGGRRYILQHEDSARGRMQRGDNRAVHEM